MKSNEEKDKKIKKLETYFSRLKEIQYILDDNQKDKYRNEAENQDIVEEKIIKVTGEVQIIKYIKGRLLGKEFYEFINQETEHSSAAKIIPKKSLVKSRPNKN